MAEAPKGFIGSMFESWRGPDRRGETFISGTVVAPPAAEEQIQRDDRDRRRTTVGKPHGVLFSTAARLEALESWLTANCAEAWSMKLAGMGEDLELKEVRIMFASPEDKAAFTRRFAE